MELPQAQHGIFEGDGYWSIFYGCGNSDIFPRDRNSCSFDPKQDLATSNSSNLGLLTQMEQESGYAFPVGESYPFLDGLAIPAELDPSFDHTKFYHDFPSIPIQEEHEGIVGDAQVGCLGQRVDGFEMGIEPAVAITDASAPAMALSGKLKSKVKKVERQPSKNLMAERRRRKRLNDRLSMLRSIVPQISKHTDRTSILGGAIDYMKELLDKIHKLHEQSTKEDIDQMNLMVNFNEVRPNEVLARNPPKFEAERGQVDTRIELRCTSKPGLLLSTVNTLEALGLDIQQCVISCFNDFSLQASCSEVAEHRRIIGSEDVKQALFRTAGYGGRCL